MRELDRVIALGYPKDRVGWISKKNHNANYDIFSVSDDGGDLFIEVKSTSGDDGRFRWTRAEFKLALEKRDRYILYRVYKTDSAKSKYKIFKDPIGMLSQEALRLDIDTLSAQVEPL